MTQLGAGSAFSFSPCCAAAPLAGEEAQLATGGQAGGPRRHLRRVRRQQEIDRFFANLMNTFSPRLR